jgi:hypothetical protein
MSDVTNKIPRSDLTTDQRRRLGAVQAAKHIVWSDGYTNSLDKSQLIIQHVDDLLLLAKYIETGDTS